MKRIVSSVFLLALSTASYSASYWTSPVQIEQVYNYYSGYYYLVAKFKGPITQENGTPLTSCAKTSAESIVGHYVSSPTIYHSQQQATLLNAHNLGKPVSLYLSSSCSAVSGLVLYGVKAIQP